MPGYCDHLRYGDGERDAWMADGLSGTHRYCNRADLVRYGDGERDAWMADGLSGTHRSNEFEHGTLDGQPWSIEIVGQPCHYKRYIGQFCHSC
ncbi:hypothetical protein QE152_g27259 [Popillia japonica]|uniref:Uncharacterized protein n=1 Tax=Popillia japonica TaxID=7064 RepID=A0AAW1JWY1_POPJA